MGDLGYLLIFLAVVAVLSFGAAWLLVRKASKLSRRQILLIAPLPVPALVMGLCFYVTIDAYSATAEECGVDACGMAIAAAFVAASAAIVVYFLGVVVAALAHRLAQSSVSDPN